MLIIILSYFVTSVIVFKILSTKRTRFKKVLNVHMCKYGFVFKYASRHRIFVGSAKLLNVKNKLYLKSNGKVAVLVNANNLYVKSDYLYFDVTNNTKLIFNAKNFYKYFNIVILSKEFDLKKLKIDAINDILNNIFNLNRCEKLIKYLKIITKILKITIKNGEIIVKNNKFYKIFTIFYKINNRIKKVNVNSL